MGSSHTGLDRVDLDQMCSTFIVAFGWQILVAGKIRQAAVLATAAYRNEATFRKLTGIQRSLLVIDKDQRNTHVRIPDLVASTLLTGCRQKAQTCVG